MKGKYCAVLTVFFTLSGAAAFGQAVWDVVYDGDYIPQVTAAVNEDLYRSQANAFEPGTLRSGDGSETPEGSPGFLRMVDDLTDQKSHRYEVKPDIVFDYAGTNGCTFVMRCRRRPGAAGLGNWDAWKFKQDGASQFFLGIGDWDGSTYHNGLSIAPTGGTVQYVGENNPGVDDWHVWRIAYYNDGGTTHITVYIDGDPSPAHSSTLDGDTTTGGLIQTVAQTSQTGEYDIDWVLITDDGDFAPDDPLGPALPPGYNEEPQPPAPPATGVDHWDLMNR